LNKCKPLNILISAGPTREPIDPVRYLSNHSSGKMGYALAAAARRFGSVTLVSGPVALAVPKNCHVIKTETAAQMGKAMDKAFAKADIIIMVAAVADYRPAQVAKQKIKKTQETLTLKLIKNPDILKRLGRKKKAGQILVGFAAETQKVLAYGKKKLVEKNLDWIIINNVAKKGIGFGSAENAVTLVSKKGKTFHFVKQGKTALAAKLLATIINSPF